MNKKIILASAILAAVTLMTSCGGQKNLIIPRAVSSADAISVGALNLQKGDYDILNTVTETASVTATYSKASLKLTGGNGDFSYLFKFDTSNGWTLTSFHGTATFGYLLQDASYNAEDLPSAEEFARRVAIARLIEAVKDYGADGVLEPIVTTRASNTGKNAVEYQATVTAKIVKIHTTN
ncbi:MAG: hypothetical protein K2G91_09695 [Prevotella sp.]|nr:hypothetical protein [Prevotella sp.]